MLFVFNKEELTTTDGLTAADVDTYELKHPHKHVVRLY
jgi:hypothetical protein